MTEYSDLRSMEVPHPAAMREVRTTGNSNPSAASPEEQLQADLLAVERISAVPTILQVISEITGLRLTLVARVTQQTWTACAVLDQMNFGLGVGDHLNVATTICSEVRDSRKPIVIEHASEEPEFCEHPTPRLYGFESYLAFPLFRTNGEYFGNLCALDAAPAVLREPRTLGLARLLAELISLQLVAEDEANHTREALAQERETAELREQFIAVLGHDLRTPLSAILTGSEFLLTRPTGEPERRLLEGIRRSGRRMSRLIDDVMDFARGRLGGGMPISLEEVHAAALVSQVVDEVASACPDHAVNVTPSGAGTAWLDRSRVAQMLSNLVSNAVEHSAPGEAVNVLVHGTESQVVFEVSNRGETVPSEFLPRLFEPYVRAEGSSSRTGLGLGLYIAAEIARAHGGDIRAESADGLTTFTAALPRAPQSHCSDGE